MTENLDQIPESRLSRWAYRLALIPILGLPLYMILAIVAVIRIGKGQTGLHTLRLGLFRMLRMTIVGVLAVGAWWFCPRWNSNNHNIKGSSFMPLLASVNEELLIFPSFGWFEFTPNEPIGYGYEMRGWSLSSEYKPFGKWIYYWEDNNKAAEGEYVNGKKSGLWLFYERDGKGISRKGKFEDGKMSGEWCFYNNESIEWKCVVKKGDSEPPDVEHWYYYPRDSIVIEYSINGDKTKYTESVKKNKRKEGFFLINWGVSIQAIKCDTWTYRDKQGNKTKEEHYDDKGKLIKTINYKDGKPIEEPND